MEEMMIVALIAVLSMLTYAAAFGLVRVLVLNRFCRWKLDDKGNARREVSMYSDLYLNANIAGVFWPVVLPLLLGMLAFDGLKPKHVKLQERECKLELREREVDRLLGLDS